MASSANPSRKAKGWHGMLAFASIGAALTTGCASSPQQSAPVQDEPRRAVGVWQLVSSEGVSAQATTLRLEVTRLGCSGGKTGTVLDPNVVYEKDQILIRTDVEPLPPGGYDCPGNDGVPLTLQLAEPIGERDLVDAACLGDEAAGTSVCENGPIRWSH